MSWRRQVKKRLELCLAIWVQGWALGIPESGITFYLSWTSMNNISARRSWRKPHSFAGSAHQSFFEQARERPFFCLVLWPLACLLFLSFVIITSILSCLPSIIQQTLILLLNQEHACHLLLLGILRQTFSSSMVHSFKETGRSLL